MISECPNCHQRTELKGSSVFWCEECKTPLYDQICPLCGKKAKRIAADIRPVFPQERLLMEIIFGEPLKYKECSVWSSASNYYLIDGRRIDFNVSDIQKIGAEKIREELDKYSSDNDDTTFNLYINRFRKNRNHYKVYLFTIVLSIILLVPICSLAGSHIMNFSGYNGETIESQDYHALKKSGKIE